SLTRLSLSLSLSGRGGSQLDPSQFLAPAGSSRRLGLSRATGALSASCSSAVTGLVPVTALLARRSGGCCPGSPMGTGGLGFLSGCVRRGCFDDRSSIDG